MKILKSCYLFNQLARNIYHRLVNINMESFFQIEFLEQLSQELVKLKELQELLDTWNIPIELLNLQKKSSQIQVATCAKELMLSVNSWLFEDDELVINNSKLNTIDIIFQQKSKMDGLCKFMDKYIKAASIVCHYELKSEDKSFLINFFDIEDEKFFAVLDKQKDNMSILLEKRNALIQTFSVWKGVGESNAFLNEAAKEKIETVDNFASKEVKEIQEVVKEELEKEIVEEVIGKETDIVIDKDESESEKETVAGLEGKDKTISVKDEFFDEKYYRDVFVRMLDGDIFSGEKKDIEKKEQIFEHCDEQIKKVDKPEKKFESLNLSVKENDKQRTRITREGNKKKLNKKSEFSKKYSEIVGKEKEYASNLGRWIDKIQNKKMLSPSDYTSIDRMCWELLLNGEFALARELASVFQNINPEIYTSLIVIELVGSGLYLPAAHPDTYKIFLANQVLVEWEKIGKFEQMAIALAAIPIAHYTKDVEMSDKVINALPRVFHDWIHELVKHRKNLNYIDSSAVESYRDYRIRLRKIRSVQEAAIQKFNDMPSKTTSYGGSARFFRGACDKDQCIGRMHNIITELEPEILAKGVVEPKVCELYNEGRKYIPEPKNLVKDFSNLVDSVIASVQEKTGFQTKIVGTNRSKMEQIFEDYLRTANEWLQLISVSCECNFYDQSVVFMEEMTDIYCRQRPMLSQYIERCEERERMQLILHQFFSVMDYLTGEKEEVPKDYKSILQHAYRLCSVPSLCIKKDELKGYHCIYKEPVEHLIFLQQIVCNQQQSIEKCLHAFVEADAYSGCDILFELMEQSQLVKEKVYFNERKSKRLKEITQHILEMKKNLYQISVFGGWLGNDYLTTISKITQMEQMLKVDGIQDVSMLCTIDKLCGTSVENLIMKFRDILKERVSRNQDQNMSEERCEELNTMIDNGQYTTVIEWATHINISDIGALKEDFFKDRYFSIYDQKEKKLLNTKGVSNKLQNAIKHTMSWEKPYFNFNTVPGSIGKYRERLICLWYSVKDKISKMIQYRQERFFYEDFKEIFELLGWEKVEIRELAFREDENEGHVRFDMFFSNTPTRDICQIPLFGSNSGTRIRMLCLYGKAYAPDKLYHLVQSNNAQIPTIILFFGVMSRMRRMELYNMALDKHTSFLVVDDIVIATLCERRESVLLPWLYKLTVPFSIQEMYTSAVGVVHPEMFYGRVSAKKELGITGSVCAVYGGRQLGKTALLKNIQYDEHKPQDDHYVYYIQLQTTEVLDPNTSITNYITDAIRNDILVQDKKYTDIKELLTDISIWLNEKPTRRLLLLLDEADRYLLADSKSGFHITRNINGVMTSMNRRFKVVFAGLHNVYRMISSPNHPLAHHGKPISIGPLLDEELQDAINLIRQPFEVMGYRFENLDLIIRILAETNYYPSLIQLFCKRLLTYLHIPKVWKMKSKNLPVTIFMSDIDTVLDDLELKREISDNFMLTLQLDQRYKAIALSIAFDAGNAAQTDALNDIVKGYDLHWIRSETEKWPNLFTEHLSLDNLRGLCDELVQLGILRSVSSDRYTLRTVNILNMLGTQESILNKLYELEREKYDYDKMYNGMLRRKMFKSEELQGTCYPLTDQQIHSILDERGLKLLFGNRALGFTLVEKCMRELLVDDMNQMLESDLCHQERYELYVHDKGLPCLAELEDSRAVHLVCPECDWKIEDLQRYWEKLMNIEEQNRPNILLLCDERKSYMVCSESSVCIDGIPIIRLSTWNLEAVQFWLEQSVDMSISEDDVKEIMARLHGWPVAMYELRDILEKQQDEQSFHVELLDQTVEELSEKGILADLLPEEKLEPLLYPVMKIFAEFEKDVRCEDVQDFLREENIEVGIERIARVIEWMTDYKLLYKQQRKDSNVNIFGIDSLILELWKKQYPVG